MNKLENLLTTLGEESAEIIKCCSKANRFGLLTIQPGKSETNEDQLWAEVNDFLGTLEKLAELTGRDGVAHQAIQAKKEKIEQYFEVSRKLGALQD